MQTSFPETLIPKILFEDTHLVVLDKPAGLLSQGEKTGDLNLVDWLRGHFGRNYVGLIHRLDRNTSGIMVVAKRTKSANRLTEALQNGKMIRTYWGWVHGSLKKPVRWRHFLTKDERTNQVSASLSPPPSSGAKEAVLNAYPIAESFWKNSPVTLLQFTLETGRSHQIRAQSAFEGHPLLGDIKYGSRDGFPRPALHSLRLEFPHPMSGIAMRYEAPLPADFKEVLKIDVK